MKTSFLPIRSRSLLELPIPIARPSAGTSFDSKLIDDRLGKMRRLLSEHVANLQSVVDVPAKGSVTEQLQRKLGTFKQMTANVAMHLDPTWRRILFQSLDSLLDSEDWHSDSAMPSEQSFSTFLRMIIYLHPTRRPGLGLSPTGRFLAAWRNGNDRIVAECLPNDEVRWVLSRTIDGERESGAGKVQIHRLPEVIEPYDPEPLFTNGDKILA